jgi:hypothetical protein
MVRKLKTTQSRVETQVATIICDSCGSAMPANAWSCPHCGDLNVDAEAAEFDYLAAESTIEQSFFPTPMEPGPFATPMHPWKYNDPESALSDEILVSHWDPHVAPLPQQDVLVPPTPQFVEPDVPQGYHDERPRNHAAPEYGQPPSPTGIPVPPPEQFLVEQGVPPVGQENEAVRVRPRIAQYTDQDNFGYLNRYGQPTDLSAQWANRPNIKYAPALELLAYIGLLGIGHIYAGHVLRGIILLTGWWGWFLVARFFSAVSNGATDGFTSFVGIIVPILSALWVANVANVLKSQG